MKTNHKISIIMHTYYRYDFLKEVLRLLAAQTIQSFEIIISDQTPINDRPPGFYENFKELTLKIINLDRPSHAPAQNIGARASSGDILIFLDDDCEFSEDFIQQHIGVLEEEKVDVVVGPNSLSEELPDNNKELDMRRRDLLSYFIKKVSFKWEGMVIYTTGGNMSIRRDFFFKVGGYDEKIPRMADVELGLRLYKSGAKIYHSTKPFLHHFKSDKGGSRKAQRDIPYLRLVSFLYIYKKHFSGWSTHQFYLKEIWGALLFRDPINGKTHLSNFKNPLYPFIRLYKLTRASIEAERFLRESKEK